MPHRLPNEEASQTKITYTFLIAYHFRATPKYRAKELRVKI
jgi:hypothetical protein